MVIDEELRTLLKNRVSPPAGSPERAFREIDQEIVAYIRENRKELWLEDILEALSDMGRCVQLLNNDNGGWYVTDSGMNTIITDEDIIENPLDMGEFISWVRNRAWKSSIRGALNDYLDREQEDIPRDERIDRHLSEQADLDELADL